LRCLLSCLAHADVEYVAPAQNQVAEIRRRRVASVLGGSVQDYVHMTVAVDHLPPVLDIVLQSDRNVGVQLLDQEVQWLP
jgi:hypothetical protein